MCFCSPLFVFHSLSALGLSFTLFVFEYLICSISSTLLLVQLLSIVSAAMLLLFTVLMWTINCAVVVVLLWCAVDRAQVVMAIEEEFCIEIPDAEADKLLSVPDAVAYISGHPMAK